MPAPCSRLNEDSFNMFRRMFPPHALDNFIPTHSISISIVVFPIEAGIMDESTLRK